MPGVVTDLSAPRPTLLIVDDDPEMRAYLRSCLSSLAGRVLEAADGAEALALASRVDLLDLVILDVHLPATSEVVESRPGSAAESKDQPHDGRSIGRRLAHRAPVLFVTGDDSVTCDGALLRKPFNRRTLRAWVTALLSPEIPPNREEIP